MLKLNLFDKMTRENRKSLASTMLLLAIDQRMQAEINKLIIDAKAEGEKMERQDAAKLLGLDYSNPEAQRTREKLGKWAHLDQTRIFSEAAIKKICERYSLRFLPSRLYRGELDAGIPAAIEEFRKANNGVLPGVLVIEKWHLTDCDGEVVTAETRGAAEDRAKRWPSRYPNPNIRLGSHEERGKPTMCIAAPRQSFELSERPAPDPLLFCDLGDGQYYLVHKWGNDLSAFRRLSVGLARHAVLVTVGLGIPLLVYLNYLFFTSEWFRGMTPSHNGAAQVFAGAGVLMATAFVFFITLSWLCGREFGIDPADGRRWASDAK